MAFHERPKGPRLPVRPRCTICGKKDHASVYCPERTRRLKRPGKR